MTPRQFRAVLVELHGGEHGAQTAAARLLGCSARSIRDYVGGTSPIPASVARLACLMRWLAAEHPTLAAQAGRMINNTPALKE